ncbi:hypothetical protein FK220_013400 [Flavobacteriaceae bacterium TP-CH-4]|uniref:Uncharacterized protein n=1 Tax=Pelagihabitans pacificus TaxID=2696054 RepID=A0A967ATZ6_9FLAO|nr:hypothetical protein [Pelagihabitans pacificus]NHF60344.1 hypothetical protein [Pelagihabitans pacificus]
MKAVNTFQHYIDRLPFVVLLSIGILSTACSKESSETAFQEELVQEEQPDQEEPSDTPVPECSNVADYVFSEKDGLVKVQFEETVFDELWQLNDDGDAFSGKGYMLWTGEQSLSNPGSGKAVFKLQIVTTGSYRFIWKSAVKMGNSGTDHNDTWLRFPDATDFYAQKGESIVYPRDSGKTPNPEGASKDGWFKIYRSGSDLDFKWQASTFDNNAHDIFVTFGTPGIYTMEISARSSGHAIDQFVLFNEAYTKSDATDNAQPFSAITCN